MNHNNYHSTVKLLLHSEIEIIIIFVYNRQSIFRNRNNSFYFIIIGEIYSDKSV